MKLGYTEFSFGFAFTENLVRSSATRPNGAPIFPNLVQEATLGYDVRVDLPGVPLFFQYKLPELMKMETAREISQYALPDFHTNFFRMPLMRRDLSNQHRLLIQLERMFPNLVFYASPTFENINQFNTAYQAARIHHDSALFSPGEIGALPDDAQHNVSYMSGAMHGWFCSDPKKIKCINFEHLEHTVLKKYEEKPYGLLETMAPDLRKRISIIVSRQIRIGEQGIRERLRQQSVGRSDKAGAISEIRLDLLVARELARIGLGLDLVVSQPKQ